MRCGPRMAMARVYWSEGESEYTGTQDAVGQGDRHGFVIALGTRAQMEESRSGG